MRNVPGQLHGAREGHAPRPPDPGRARHVAEGEVRIRLVHAALDRAPGREARELGRARRRHDRRHARCHDDGGDERETRTRARPRHGAGGYRHPGVLQSRTGDDGDRAGNADGRTTPGTDVVPRATPVPAPPPGVTDVLRRSAQLGLGALGLAGRAAGTVFARVPDPGVAAPDAEPGIAALLPGAVLGMALEAEKRASAVIDTVAAHSTGVVRAVGKPAIVQRALRPLEDRLWQWNEVARREQAPQPGAGVRAHPGDRAAGHRERDRATRLRAHRRADPRRRHRRRDRRRGDRAAHRPRRRHPRVDDGRRPPRRSTRCARRAITSTSGRRGSSTASCCASNRATARDAATTHEGDPQRAVTRGAGPARRDRVAGDRRRARCSGDLRARLRGAAHVRVRCASSSPTSRTSFRSPGRSSTSCSSSWSACCCCGRRGRDRAGRRRWRRRPARRREGRHAPVVGRAFWRAVLGWSRSASAWSGCSSARRTSRSTTSSAASAVVYDWRPGLPPLARFPTNQ